MQSVVTRCPAWALFLFAFLAGSLNVLAFAPAGFWPLQLFGLAVMFGLTSYTNSKRRVMQLTWLYSFGWLFFGVIWLTVTMFRYGDMPVWLSVICVALFSGSISLIPMLFMAGAAHLKLRYRPASWMVYLVLFPTFWSLTEWTRDWLFTGFPWLVSGYAHNLSPLAGFAPLIGVYGITWITALIAGSAVLVMERQLIFGLFIVVLFMSGGALQTVRWTEPHGAALTVRLLQGNIDQNIKFEREHLIDSLHYYFDAITQKPAGLIVTPESALPLPLMSLPSGYLDQLQQFASDSHSHIALGLFNSDGPDQFANSMITISPVMQSGENRYRYDKHHLVPFGEFIPKGFAWFYHYMNIPMGDLQRGPLLALPFPVQDQQILPNICYEDVFGEEIAARISYAYFSHHAVPTILLNMTNLSWFGDSWAMPQHLQITQMRALETGRPMLRSTNTGVTALVNAQGQIVSQLKTFERGDLTVSVQGYEGMTPYIICGNYLWLGLMGLLALVSAGMHFAITTTRNKKVTV